MSPQPWVNIQKWHDLEVIEDLLEDRLADEVHFFQAETG